MFVTKIHLSYSKENPSLSTQAIRGALVVLKKARLSTILCSSRKRWGTAAHIQEKGESSNQSWINVP